MADPLPSDDETDRSILACGHVWDSADDWKPVQQYHVVPMGEGRRGVAVGSVCARCAARDRSGYPTWDEAWTAARAP